MGQNLTCPLGEFGKIIAGKINILRQELKHHEMILEEKMKFLGL
jgi:hypothetical protein